MKNVFKFIKYNPYFILAIIVSIVSGFIFSWMPLLVALTSVCLITVGIIMDKDLRDLMDGEDDE